MGGPVRSGRVGLPDAVQIEPGRADHACIVAQRRGLEPQALGKARHDAAQHALAKGRDQQRLLRGDAAADEHHLRIEDVH